jgi:glycosyltransferase involved in cell wall biosynthesis
MRTRDKVRSLLIVSHAIHYRFENRLYAYGPYAREIDIWADLFPKLRIAAPCRMEKPPGDCLPFARTNICVLVQKETGGESIKAKMLQILALPGHVTRLARAMWSADAIHVRCAGNLGFLGAIMAPLFSRYLVAKYANQWSTFPGEPWTWKLQRRLLRSRWWRGPVTVYGHWPDQPPHVIPFFTSIMSRQQLERARVCASRRTLNQPLRVLYVGRLSTEKNVHVLIDSIARLAVQGIRLDCRVVGEGPKRMELEAQVRRHGLQDRIRFAGGLCFEEVLNFYEWADVLTLATSTEGWPKSLVEAMAFGLVCVGTNQGAVPFIVGDGRGLTVSPGDVHALTMALERIARTPEEFRCMRARAASWAQNYSLEGLREALRNLLSTWWQLPFGADNANSSSSESIRANGYLPEVSSGKRW